MSSREVTAERLPNGTFAPGHVYVGRSDLHALQLAKRRAILEATTTEQAVGVIEAMRREAMEGSVPAAAVFLSYVVGRPESIEPKDAAAHFDAHNLNKSAADLTPEQRRSRLQFLLAEQAKGSK